MSVDLEDRPSSVYDDGKPSWKTNVHNDDLENSFNAPSATNDDLPDGHPDHKKKDHSLSELKEKEAAINNEGASTSDNESASLYTGNSKKKKSFRSRITRRQAGIGAFAAAGLVSAITAITLQAPNLIINNLKELLLDRVATVQLHQTRKYRQNKIGKLKNYMSRDGRMGQKIISEMEADGYKFAFDGNQIKGITPPNGGLKPKSSIIGDAVGDHIDEYMEIKHPLRRARWKTKRMNALYKKFGVSRTSVVDVDKIKDAPKTPDGELDAERTVNKEVASDVLEGDDTDITINKSTNPDKEAQDAENQKIKDLEEQSSDIGDEQKAERAKIIETGTPEDELSPNVRATVEAGSSFTPELDNAIKDTLEKQGVGSKLAGELKGLANPTDILDKACTVRSRMSAAVTLARAARAIKLIRYAFVFINAADDTRRNKANPKLVSALMGRAMAEDKNGNSIGASQGFASLMKGKFSKKKNDAGRGNVAVDGQLTGLLGGVNNSFDSVPGMQTGCPYVQNPVFQVGTGVASIAVGFFSGGASEGVTLAFEEGFTQGVKAVVKETVEQIAVKEIAKGIAVDIAKDLTFEGIMTMTEMYVQKSLNIPYTGQEKGGQLGDILVAGAGTANKQRSLAAGMVPATTQEYAMAEQEYIAWHNDELKQMSFKERMFDINNTDSLAFKMATTVPMGANDLVKTSAKNSVGLATSVLNPSTLFKSLFGMIAPRASAATDDEVTFDEIDINGNKLATDFAGNPQVIMRSDIEAIDPESNIESLIASGDIDSQTYEPISDAFKAHIERCVTNADLYSEIEGKGVDSTDVDCLAKKQITKQYKAHLAYLNTTDDLEAEFFPEEINQPTSAAPSVPTGTETAPTNTQTIDIGQTTIIPGTTGARIATNTLPQVVSMLDAARNDGIELLPISSAWRDPQQQVALRKQNCPDWQNSPASACNPPTAKPGTSEHEKGQAIDFGSMCYPSGEKCPGNARWEWLTANASRFGFKPLSSEAWHWSLTGN